MMFQRTLAVMAFTLLIGLVPVLAQDTEPSPTPYSPVFPISVESCGETITFEAAPERALAFDTNLTEIMLALELEDRMAGYWLSGDGIAEVFQDQIEAIPLISEETWPPPGLETILSFNPDFVFGSWGGTFSQESGVTPETLLAAGVQSYTLTESCITADVQIEPTLENTYTDILNIGRIFGAEDRAQVIVDDMRAAIEEVQSVIGEVDMPVRAFYYGGGDDAPFSTGRYGTPSVLMGLVGMENILNDLEDDWTFDVSWETVIERDPEVIIVEDAPWESAEDRIAILQSLPQLASITAIQEGRFIALPYRNVLSGLDVDEAVRILAVGAYPDLFE
ncbi:MAG: ABC transporter substrate-binding protein [Blastochloris sp.]|nr:ABC transporter substrate-binding protein [Blastochloris sp.]